MLWEQPALDQSDAVDVLHERTCCAIRHHCLASSCLEAFGKPGRSELVLQTDTNPGVHLPLALLVFKLGGHSRSKT